MCPPRRTLRHELTSVRLTGAGYRRIGCVMSDLDEGTPPQEGYRHPRAVRGLATSIVVEDRAEAAVLRELSIAAEHEQAQVERLVALRLGVDLSFDVDRLCLFERVVVKSGSWSSMW